MFSLPSWWNSYFLSRKKDWAAQRFPAPIACRFSKDVHKRTAHLQRKELNPEIPLFSCSTQECQGILIAVNSWFELWCIVNMSSSVCPCTLLELHVGSPRQQPIGAISAHVMALTHKPSFGRSVSQKSESNRIKRYPFEITGWGSWCVIVQIMKVALRSGDPLAPIAWQPVMLLPSFLPNPPPPPLKTCFCTFKIFQMQ